jgi:hypothetical protein
VSELLNVQGKIVKCGAYPIKNPQPFQYQGKTINNTHRLSIQLDDGNWYGMGDTDKDNFIHKDNDGTWKVLGAGSQVLIQYKLSDCGKYRNSKKSLLTVLNLVEGERYEAKDKPQAGGSTASSGTTNPAEVGQCINLTGLNLIDLSGMGDGEVAQAVADYKQIKERFTKAFNEPNTPVQSAQPAPQGQGHVDSYEPDFEDDIPFN